MPPELRHELTVYADHLQFYVLDADQQDDIALLWDGDALERHLGAVGGIVAVGTVGYTFLPVELELRAGEPGLDEGWDHVAEASLELRSGRLAVASINGPVENLEPIRLEPGTYRVRASGAGLDGATEMDGGDRWRIQVWQAPTAEPRVLRWWPQWDPAGTRPQPRTSGGHVIVGAEAHDARVRMQWLSSRGIAHLFRDDDGVLWEHSTLRDVTGTPQLEVLTADEAERRYGRSSAWGHRPGPQPGVATMAKSILKTLRYARGWRPPPDPPEAVVEAGRRVIVGNTAINRLYAMRWLGSEGGDSLYADDDGVVWEWRSAEGGAGRPRLRELSADEAEVKYGTSGAGGDVS